MDTDSVTQKEQSETSSDSLLNELIENSSPYTEVIKREHYTSPLTIPNDDLPEPPVMDENDDVNRIPSPLLDLNECVEDNYIEPALLDLSEPEPVNEPEPEPVKETEPIKEPQPEPIKEPEPEPIKEPQPEPVKESEPEPVKTPEPEPVKTPAPTVTKLDELISQFPVPEPAEDKQSYPEDSKQDSELVTVPTFSPTQSVDGLKEPLLSDDPSRNKTPEDQRVSRRCGDNCIIC